MTGGGGGPLSDGPVPSALMRAFPEPDSGRFWWPLINRVIGGEHEPNAADALMLLILEWMPDWQEAQRSAKAKVPQQQVLASMASPPH